MIRFTFRSLVALLAAFALLNIAAGLLIRGADATVWWIDVRWMPAWMGPLIVAISASLILLAVLRPHTPALRHTGILAAAALCSLTLIDVARFYLLKDQGTISTSAPFPASILPALILAAGAWAILTPGQPLTWPHRSVCLAASLAIAASFPLLQMLCFGLTDYRRTADAILVFGARTYADGTPSDALSDRVHAAADLYHAGLAPQIIMSGGPGDGPTHETQAMRRLAIDLGIPDDRIILDPHGINTAASVRFCQSHAIGRVLAVSHFYHLPRIKLEAAHAGVQLFTVPAPQQRPLRGLPWFMARETAAWWWYYARPIVG